MGIKLGGTAILDGMADREMVQVVQLAPDGSVAVIAPEDSIADRMGQYASGSALEMLGQARALFALCESLDFGYMERRIREETMGDHGIQDLEDQT